MFDHAVGIALGATRLLDRQQTGVLTRQADAAHVRLLAGHGDPVGDLFIHRARKHHLGDLHRRRIGNPQPIDEAGLHPRLVQHGADLRPAAMHHHRVHAHQLQQHHIGRKLTRHRALAHGVTAVFNDHGLAVIDLNIRQGLGERLRRLPAAFFRLAFCFVHHAREIAGDVKEVTE